MKPVEMIEKYQNKELYDLCCSESILYAANEYLDLGLNESALKMSAALCGGNLIEDTCGLYTTSIMVLAAYYCEGSSHKSLVMREKIKEFRTVFLELFEDDNCKKLKEKYRDEFIGCKKIIVLTFIALIEFIEKK